MNEHSGAIMILIMVGMVLGTLLFLVPQMLKMQQRFLEMQHEEHMGGLAKGVPVPPTDYLTRAAARTTSLVPMVVIVSAAVVTCFLSAYRPAEIFSVSLTVWCVAGVVSLTAITGGVALMGRLAHVRDEDDEADGVRTRLPEFPDEHGREDVK